MTRSCSHCGNNGHNSRTCADTGDGGIMLFGVRLTEGPIRKSVSLNNLSQYEQPQDPNADIAAGYASDDVVHLSSGNRERKRGVPWTEEEHKLFLLGLQKVGKGDWRGISRNFVKTRTPTQVASHAQKYFLRRNSMNRRRRRSSLFDITTDTFMGLPIEEEHVTQEIASPTPQPPQMNCNLGGYHVPAYPMTMSPAVRPISLKNNLTLGRGDQTNISSTNLVRPTPVFPLSPASRIPDLDLNQKSIMDPSPMSLKLSSLSSSDQQSLPKHSAFQALPSFSGSDSIIIGA